MRLHILTFGPFGAAVGGRLTAAAGAHGDDVTLADVEAGPAANPAFWPTADLRVLVGWRESGRLTESLDRSAAETGTPYTVAVLGHPRLRVGPTIVPGTGGCHRCHDRRRRQHDPGLAKAAALFARYESDPAAGPAGYLPHHVSLATGLLTRVVAAAREGRLADERNQVRSVHLLQGTVSATSLVPVHGCSRCGTRRPDSTWRDLATELVLSGAVEGGVTRG